MFCASFEIRRDQMCCSLLSSLTPLSNSFAFLSHLPLGYPNSPPRSPRSFASSECLRFCQLGSQPLKHFPSTFQHISKFLDWKRYVAQLWIRYLGSCADNGQIFSKCTLASLHFMHSPVSGSRCNDEGTI